MFNNSSYLHNNMNSHQNKKNNNKRINNKIKKINKRIKKLKIYDKIKKYPIIEEINEMKPLPKDKILDPSSQYVLEQII